jgi:hypothetical protein
MVCLDRGLYSCYAVPTAVHRIGYGMETSACQNARAAIVNAGQLTPP